MTNPEPDYVNAQPDQEYAIVTTDFLPVRSRATRQIGNATVTLLGLRFSLREFVKLIESICATQLNPRPDEVSDWPEAS